MSLFKSTAMASRRLLWSPRARLLLGISISPLVVYFIVRDIDWGALSSQLHDFPVRYALASLLIFSLAMGLRAYRWQVLFLEEKVPLHRLLLVQNAGIGLNSLSPIRIISEAVQFILLTVRYPVKKEVVAATLGGCKKYWISSSVPCCWALAVTSSLAQSQTASSALKSGL